ncbi:uncharacterized protein F5147DRAFT_82674 [Suillus discolor]|uniref:Uncharacterized protein n=1 Tax=Suillus discolor TaxID=1912936 RepID=A0A9P7JLT5_9AGAM|nr:uncharacterized protein F5147DRAFT_82674 [Suillus discolor]KAG2086085.1 hypothetical protein F5147DRAFT_82674 [Suillus discolor]
MSQAPPCRTVPGLLFFTPTALSAAGRFSPSYIPSSILLISAVNFSTKLIHMMVVQYSVTDHRRPTSIFYSPNHLLTPLLYLPSSLSRYGHRMTKGNLRLRSRTFLFHHSLFGRNKYHFIFWNVQPYPAHQRTFPTYARRSPPSFMYRDN